MLSVAVPVHMQITTNALVTDYVATRFRGEPAATPAGDSTQHRACSGAAWQHPAGSALVATRARASCCRCCCRPRACCHPGRQRHHLPRHHEGQPGGPGAHRDGQDALAQACARSLGVSPRANATRWHCARSLDRGAWVLWFVVMRAAARTHHSCTVTLGVSRQATVSVEGAECVAQPPGECNSARCTTLQPSGRHRALQHRNAGHMRQRSSTCSIQAWLSTSQASCTACAAALWCLGIFTPTRWRIGARSTPLHACSHVAAISLKTL